MAAGLPKVNTAHPNKAIRHHKGLHFLTKPMLHQGNKVMAELHQWNMASSKIRGKKVMVRVRVVLQGVSPPFVVAAFVKKDVKLVLNVLNAPRVAAKLPK